MSRNLALALVALAAVPLAAQEHHAPKAPKSMRLYIFDCGVLKPADAAMFNFKKGDIAVLDMSVPCFLIAHPKGTLMWDAGTVPDSDFKGDGSPVVQGMIDRLEAAQAAARGHWLPARGH